MTYDKREATIFLNGMLFGVTMLIVGILLVVALNYWSR